MQAGTRRPQEAPGGALFPPFGDRFAPEEKQGSDVEQTLWPTSPGGPAEPAGPPELVRVFVGGAVLRARRGELVLLDERDTTWNRRIFAALRGEQGPHGALIGGRDPRRCNSAERRRLVGYAGLRPSRHHATIAEAVTRDPSASEPVGQALDRVGLLHVVSALPHGVHTRLGGNPRRFSDSEGARLRLARAFFGQPPVVIVDRIDQALGSGSAPLLCSLIRQHPGVVVLASGDDYFQVTHDVYWGRSADHETGGQSAC